MTGADTPPDWRCPRCLGVNRPADVECYRCGLVIPSDGRTEAGEVTAG